MNEHSTAGEPQGLAHPPLHGLREAREAQGLHIAILSTALKVPVRKLEALEAGRYEELPGLTFARALASSACRHLKIDPEPILAQIPVAASPLAGAGEPGIDAPFTRADETRVPSSGWLSRPALVLAGVLLAGALLVVFWPQGLPTVDVAQTEAPAVSPAPAAEPAPAVVTEPVTTQSPAAAEPAPKVAAPDAAAASAVPSQPTLTPTTPPAASSATSTATPPVAEAPTPAAGSLMSIRATSESWVEVTNASGTVLLRRLLTAGEVVNFASAPPYAVLLGRAEAAEVMVRGQRFDTTPFVRNSVARFEVK